MVEIEVLTHEICMFIHHFVGQNMISKMTEREKRKSDVKMLSD